MGLRKSGLGFFLIPCGEILSSCWFGKMVLWLGRDPAMECLCAWQALQLELPQIHLTSISWPSPLLLQRRLMAGAAGSGRSCQRGKSLSQDLCGVMKTSNPPAYQLPSHGGNHWLTALTAGARKLLISSLKSSGFCSPAHSLASSLPANDYCLTLSFRLLVQAWCCCCHPPCHFPGHNPCGRGIFSPAKEEGQWEGKSTLHLSAQLIYSRR